MRTRWLLPTRMFRPSLGENIGMEDPAGKPPPNTPGLPKSTPTPNLRI